MRPLSGVLCVAAIAAIVVVIAATVVSKLCRHPPRRPAAQTPLAVSALDALLHLLNFVLTPALYGGVAAGLAKLVWYERLHASTWLRLALWATAGALLGQIAGVAFTGREGTVSGYAFMLTGGIAGLLWAGRAGLLLRS
jgi:hypothetical protein